MDVEEMNSALGEEMSELEDDAGQEAVLSKEDSVESIPRPKRGRPIIPPKWTTVISLDHDLPLSINLNEIAPDLLLADALARTSNERQ